MIPKKTILIATIFIVPFTLGISIVGYWYWTTRIEKRSLLPSYGTVPEFSLTTQAKLPFTADSLAGRITVVDFIFTECAGACPMMSTKMADLQRTFADESRIRFVSFSVDPATDTPPVLTEYGARYGADPRRWTFLTGDRKAIESLTKSGFHLGLDIEGENAILHSQKFVLVDQHAAIRGYYDSEDDASMKTLVRDARILAAKISS